MNIAWMILYIVRDVSVLIITPQGYQRTVQAVCQYWTSCRNKYMPRFTYLRNVCMFSAVLSFVYLSFWLSMPKVTLVKDNKHNLWISSCLSDFVTFSTHFNIWSKGYIAHLWNTVGRQNLVIRHVWMLLWTFRDILKLTV